MKTLSDSNFRPAPQQVVVDAGKLHDGRIVRLGRVDALDCRVEIEQQSALTVVCLLLVSGWKGWEMVYRHHVGVSDEPPPMVR